MVTKLDLTIDVLGVLFFAFFMILSMWLIANYRVSDIWIQFILFVVSGLGLIVFFLMALGYCAMFKDDWEKYRYVDEYR